MVFHEDIYKYIVLSFGLHVEAKTLLTMLFHDKNCLRLKWAFLKKLFKIRPKTEIAFEIMFPKLLVRSNCMKS